jgi:hypothetical protein
MSLPITIQIEATPNFLANLDAVHAFLVEQDAASATVRFNTLKAELREMLNILSWSPASARPARFLHAHSAQACLRAAAVQQLAAQAGLPHLREYVVSHHVVLYAHSSTELALLAIKHQRQLSYWVE